MPRDDVGGNGKPPRAPGVADDVIGVDRLTYAYPDAAHPAVRDVSFEIRRGEIFGLLGPSGAGKSTIQRILTRQIRQVEAGVVRVFGRDIGTWRADYFERIGVGFELPNHYLRLTGAENLQFFAALYDSRTRAPAELLELVGLEDAARQRVADYSKGMMIRLNFARALLHDPELLFLDEPTTGLDPTTAGNIKRIIAGLKAQGKTVVLTTHNMHDADALCDRVGFLSHGQMKALDTPDAFKRRYGARRVEVVVEDERAEISRVFPLDELGRNAAFIELISNHRIVRIHSQEASLDAVFEIVTGDTLSSGQ